MQRKVYCSAPWLSSLRVYSAWSAISGSDSNTDSASEFVPDAVVTAHGIFTGEEVREVKVISIELQAYPSFQSIGLASFHQAAELVRSCHCLTCF
jgi:hypothetical protein